jgi:hypothetical protein
MPVTVTKDVLGLQQGQHIQKARELCVLCIHLHGKVKGKVVPVLNQLSTTP